MVYINLAVGSTFGGYMIDVYREPNQIIVSKGSSLITDKGELTRAIQSSSGGYIFSEVGAGVKPLVLIGTIYEITEFLYEHRDVLIKNQIKELPNIYMNISPYVPRGRFESISQVRIAVNAVLKELLSFTPVGTYESILTDGSTFLGLIKDIFFHKKDKNKETKDQKIVYYLRISYIGNDGAELIGTGTIPMRSVLYKLFGIKETSV